MVDAKTAAQGKGERGCYSLHQSQMTLITLTIFFMMNCSAGKKSPGIHGDAT